MKKKIEATKRLVRCKDCANHYDEHEKNIYGESFMCWCRKERWAQFLITKESVRISNDISIVT